MEKLDVNQPLVSILITNYNYADFLAQAIDSALGQTYKNTEIVVVDDGSTDNSREVIEGYGNKIISIFKDNGGQTSALNAAFSVSQGEIIFLLDADDIFLPNKVTEVVDLFMCNPGIDWVFNESAPISSEDLRNTDLEAVFQKISHTSSEVLPSKIDFRANILNAELPNFTPSTSNLCFTRRLLKKIFPLPEVEGYSGIAITDLYIKYLAVGLGTGYASTKNLGIFRLHDNNVYSTEGIVKKRKLFAEIHILSAYCMRAKFPTFSKLSKKLFSKGLATYLKLQNHENHYEDTIRKYFFNTYLVEKLEIACKTLYYWIRLMSADLV